MSVSPQRERGTSAAQRLLRTWLDFSDAHRFDEGTRDARAVQERYLLGLAKRNADTAYGREHDFGKIRSIEDFRTAVPPNSYESLEPYVERTLRGEKHVLTADDPLMFATTSGTTGKAKYIPVTSSYMHEYSHGVHVHLYRILGDFGHLMDGKFLVPTSNDVEGHSEGGLPYGAISGYLARQQPGAIKRYYALPYELCKVKDVEAKYYLTLRHALMSDIRLIMMPNPSSMVLLGEKLAQHADELIEDVRNGTIDPKYLPEGSPPELTEGLEPDPRRAAELDSLLRSTGTLLPIEVWPNLQLLSCWKGGTMPLYLRKLPEFYGDTPVRDLGYMASEGRGSTPLANSGAAGVLNVTSHFYEFLPEADRDNPNATFLTCDELEPNREYYVHFTTSAGLYRYDINDVVRVVDWYRHAPVVQFVRKGQGMTSITGEKLTESQVTGALCESVDDSGYEVEHFTAAVEWADPPHYAFYAELGDGMTPDRERAFLRSMDKKISDRNIEYAAKRESLRLGPPVLKRVAPGTYQAMRQKRVAEGAPEAQVKLPQLSPNMEFGKDLNVIEEVGFDG
jgi:hypothetical protein